tara:strand:+ start:2195 stop:2482 length:288 start_codon:yes stop_codon:yes gene_type:complete
MKSFILLVLFNTSITSTFAQDKVIDLKPSIDGKLSYMANVNGEYKIVENQFVMSVASDLIKKAKELACNLPVKPDSVNASIGVVSFSWNTDRLCK